MSVMDAAWAGWQAEHSAPAIKSGTASEPVEEALVAATAANALPDGAVGAAVA